MMLNPYADVNWGTAISVKSISHEHIVSQARFDAAVERGYQHLAISHYQPSAPVYPLSESPYFTGVPDYMLGSPNSEKVKATTIMNHVNALGSFCVGYGAADQPTKTWEEVFEDILSQLQYEDGGGITVNHPRGNPPTKAGFDLVITELDYDPRVLGIEIYNHYAFNRDINYLFMTQMWDLVLSTGRRCWGFSVVDWDEPEVSGPAMGSNLLLVPEYTERECLKAYRNGAFYCLVDDTGLRFTSITASQERVSTSVNSSCEIQFYTDKGLAKTVVGTEASYDVKPNDIYVRIEARQDNQFKRILSNPIRYMDQDEVTRMNHINKLKRYAAALLSD